MNIEVMSASDINEVKQIEVECNSSPWSLFDYSNETNRGDTMSFVARKESKVVGFIVSRLITNTDYQLITKNLVNNQDKIHQIVSVEIEIYNIAVDPSFQKKGIGSALLQQIIVQTDHLQSRIIWLEVRESNIKAIEFYEKWGFNKISKRKNFYNNPNEDGIVMNKLLKKF